ncbi:hypothetical protein Hanom_Chr06g00567241 [Helianthus anomalus]
MFRMFNFCSIKTQEASDTNISRSKKKKSSNHYKKSSQNKKITYFVSNSSKRNC